MEECKTLQQRDVHRTSAGLSIRSLVQVPRGPDKLDLPDLLFINFNPPVTRRPVDFLCPGPELRLNRLSIERPACR
ncbi:hypothetical protein TNCV_850061 [Trichonephila clavipes]|uniref:Uncharacterized protein n=1 Tax=Trichonephila clavipes TaxID=2585209 RepID=A0A8X6S6J7_TRICX|nr:hypothetical protein TNCV_850061 [Trichonephila clavipes]